MWTAAARQRYAWTRRKEGARLTDPEWALLEPLLPRQASVGRPWKHPLRTIMDAILHLLRTGCSWSALPDWAPPRSTIYECLGAWLTVAGSIESITDFSWLCANSSGGRAARRSGSWTARRLR